MICYAIKNEREKYAHRYYIYEDENWSFCQLNNATIYDTFEEAKEKSEYISRFCKIPTKVVKVEIREVAE